MDVETPIFVTGFSGGGTSVLINLLASHPDVCTVGEVRRIFQGSKVLESAWQIVSKAVTRDQPIGARTQEFVRCVLHRAKLTANDEYLSLFKGPDVCYTSEEREQARMLGRHLDERAFLSRTMLQLYPEAEIVGLIRNGFAVCESHVRRGKSARDVGRLYRVVAEKMLADRQHSPNFHIVKFDELVQKPVRILKHLSVRLGLNPFQLEHVRCNDSKPLRSWVQFTDLPNCLDKKLDDRRIQRLNSNDREAFLKEAGEVMERLDYVG